LALRPFRAGLSDRALGRHGNLGRQTVFHQPNLHAASVRGLLSASRLGFTENHRMQTVDGNLVFVFTYCSCCAKRFVTVR